MAKPENPPIGQASEWHDMEANALKFASLDALARGEKEAADRLQREAVRAASLSISDAQREWNGDQGNG